MKITGREAIPFPVEQVWDALLDPAVLVRTIPGLRASGDDGRAHLRDDRDRRRRRDPRHLRRHLRAVGPRAARVAGDAAPGRRRARARSTPRCSVAVRGRRATRPRSRTTPTRSSAAWSAASASGCSARCPSGWPASSSATSRTRSPSPAYLPERRPARLALPGRDARRRPCSAVGQVFTAPRPPGVLPAGLPQGHRRRRRAGAARRRSPAASSAGGGGDRSRSRLDRVRPRRAARQGVAMAAVDSPPARWRRPGGDLRPRAAGPAPGPDRRAQPAAERDRLASTRSAPGRARRRPTRRRRGATRSGRCTACRSRSRTPTTSPAGVRRTARRCSPTTCPTPTTSSSSGSGRPARCTIGKTNVPEFAAGSHTFNTVFGTTLNPVDPTRSAGGSSGGAACALRAGMVPLADGSDMGGSLRNPASFCGVVGLRPSLGRVPSWPTDNFWETHLGTSGPLARNVERPRAAARRSSPGPTRASRPRWASPVRRSRPPLAADLAGLRVALSPDLGGLFEVDARGTPRGRGGRRGLRGGRARRSSRRTPTSPRPTTPSAPCAPGSSRRRFGELLAAHPDSFKQSLADNIRAGERAHRRRRRPRLRSSAPRWPSGCALFFESYDVLVLPTSQVPPFPADQEYPRVDQRPPDGDVPGLDALGVRHHRDRLSGDLGAGRGDRRRAAGRGPDRGAVRCRPASARGRGGLRARRDGA